MLFKSYLHKFPEIIGNIYVTQTPIKSDLFFQKN